MKDQDRPYVLCSVNGFDRVPDTKVLLRSEDYDALISYIDKALDENPDADIEIDPDDCGECYESLETFKQYNISARPIKSETYEDIRHAYVKEHFGFNYVLDSVLYTLYNTLESKLTPDEVKWFALRSETVSWAVEDKKRTKTKAEKVDRKTAFLAANGIKNCSAAVCQLVSEHIIDVDALREQIDKITEYTEELESCIPI